MKAWLKAFRLRTLPLAFSSILLGSFLAAKEHQFRLDILLLALLTTLFLQILSNLANDYGDYEKGTDNANRVGPSRTVQAGLISPTAMKAAIFLFGALAFASGCTLLYVAGAFQDTRILLFFLGLGVLCIIAAITYTMGKNAYGYKGLGDISVLLFFGFVGVLGTCYLMTKSFYPLHILPSLSCGLLAMGVLNLNNLRDIENDRDSGKRSIPVIIGFAAGKNYQLVLIITSYLCLLTFIVLSNNKWLDFLPLALLPLYILLLWKINKTTVHKEMDKFLKTTALLSLLTTCLVGIGQIY